MQKCRKLCAFLFVSSSVKIGVVFSQYLMTHHELVNHLISSGVLKSKNLVDAFTVVDRGDFVPEQYADFAYEDQPLPLGFSQSISQPSTVAFMLELLSPQPGEKILEVGSGSGWAATMLAHAVGADGQVFALELIPQLVEYGRDRAKRHSTRKNLQILPASYNLGLPEQAPFDKILVSAGADELPYQMLEQLAEGGRVVMPVVDAIWSADKLSADRAEIRQFPGFAFVPLQYIR